MNPIGPRACYDEGKRCAETLATSYARQYGVDVRIARIFNTCGPRMHENDGRVVSNFVVQALAGQPLTVFGDGKQTRSFCYVSDLIEVFLRLMASPHGCDPVNLGNPRETSMLELATLVRDVVGSRTSASVSSTSACVRPEALTNSTSIPSGAYTSTTAPRSPRRRPCSGKSRG